MIHILNMVIQLLQYHLLRLSFKNLFIINIVIVLVCVCSCSSDMYGSVCIAIESTCNSVHVEFSV